MKNDNVSLFGEVEKLTEDNNFLAEEVKNPLKKPFLNPPDLPVKKREFRAFTRIGGEANS